MLTPDGDTWVALTDEVLSPGMIHDWAVRPDCGAVALFSGTVRDHAEHRTGVTELEYEAYAEEVEPRLHQIVDAARDRWPDLGRVALIHRIGLLGLGYGAGYISIPVVFGDYFGRQAFAGTGLREGVYLVYTLYLIASPGSTTKRACRTRSREVRPSS